MIYNHQLLYYVIIKLQQHTCFIGDFISPLANGAGRSGIGGNGGGGGMFVEGNEGLIDAGGGGGGRGSV